jgi:membrane protease YdiL (CAAX protease family)
MSELPSNTAAMVRKVAFILWSAILAIGTAAVASVLIVLFAELNVRIAPNTPWFVLPAAGLAVLSLVLSEGWFEPKTPAVRLRLAHVIAVIVAISLGLAVIALLLMYHALQTQYLALPGDGAAAPESFRVAKSFTILLGAAVIEESAFRGALQLRLQRVLPVKFAELLADTSFVLVHLSRFGDPGEVPFVVLLAIVNGRVASATQSVRIPVAIHFLANGLICVAVLKLRILPVQS